MRETFLSRALLLRAVPYRESDLICTWLTESRGVLGTLARGARRSQKRMGGALEPMHTAQIELEEPSGKGGDLLTLKGASVQRVRLLLTRNLSCMEGAGQALRWVRELCPPRAPEPIVFERTEALLDDLDSALAEADVGLSVICFGLSLLVHLGYGPSFAECAVCGRPRPAGKVAFVDAARGGVVCVQCGGAGRAWPGALLDALGADEEPLRAGALLAAMDPTERALWLPVLETFVRELFASHAGARGGARSSGP